MQELITLLEGKYSGILAIYFYSIDMTAISILFRGLHRSVITQAKQLSIISELDYRQYEKDSALVGIKGVLYFLSLFVIFYCGKLRLPELHFLKITLVVIFISYVVFALPVYIVLVIANNKRLKAAKSLEKREADNFTHDIHKLAKQLGYVSRVLTFTVSLTALGLEIQHQFFYELL